VDAGSCVWATSWDTCYNKTDESSVTVPIHNELDVKVLQLKENGFESQFSSDVTHLCRGMGVRIPFLPVRTKEEFHAFSIIMFRSEMDRFNGEKMALF
jgi:hypothetical protein